MKLRLLISINTLLGTWKTMHGSVCRNAFNLCTTDAIEDGFGKTINMECGLLLSTTSTLLRIDVRA